METIEMMGQLPSYAFRAYAGRKQDAEDGGTRKSTFESRLASAARQSRDTAGRCQSLPRKRDLIRDTRLGLGTVRTVSPLLLLQKLRNRSARCQDVIGHQLGGGLRIPSLYLLQQGVMLID